VTISGGILKAGSNTALGDVGNTITINSTGALDVNAINLQGYTSAITINGQMDATDGALFNSSGTQQINAIQAIALGSDASIGSNGGRFDIGRGYSGSTNITGNSHKLTKVGTNQVCIITQSTGLTSVVVNGGMLSGECTNVFGGAPITVNSGGQISQWNTITSSDSIYLNGGTLLGQFEYGNAFSSAWSGPIALAASTIDTLMADVSSVVNPITLSGKISGSGGLVKAGAGLDILSNTNNNFGGGLTINQGVLQLGASNVIPDGASAGDVTVNDTLDMHGYSEGINGLNGAGTGVVTTKAAGTPTLTEGNNNASSTFTGIIQNGSGTLTLSKTGSGSLTLSGANTYSGGTNLNAGTLNINGTAAIGATASRLTIAGGTTIDNSSGGPITLANNNTQTWNGNFTFTGTQSLNMGTGAVTLGATPQITVSSNTLTEGGVISGAYGLTNAGTGTLSLTGANSYTGVTTISGGILSVATLAPGSSNSGIGASGTGAANLVLNGGTLQFSGASSQRTDRNFTINSTGGTIDASGGAGDTIGISGASTIASGSPTLTLVGSNTSNNTLSGVLGGALSLAKSGAGTWVVSGNNTYNGGTTISAGTLLVNNTSGSGTGSAAVTANGGTLGGTGTISGAVSVSSGATLSPGSATTGILTLGSNLTFSAGAAYAVNVNGTTAGTQYDQTAVSGTVTLNSATLTLSLGYTPVIGDTFTIINNQGSNSVVGTFNNIAEGGTVSAVYNGNTATFHVSYADNDGNDVTLTCSNITGAPVDDYSQWHYSKKVYINTKEGGANIRTDQSNFPLLIRLTSANFNFSQAQSGGQDVRFAKSTGVHFPYQIERWDNVNQLAELWVNVDVIKGYNDAQYIMMYWGNSAAADSESSSKVFATTNNFAGVWHLKEDPSGGSNAIKDATGNANNGTSTGSMTSSELVSAVVGNGVNFNGTSQAITVPDAASLDITAGITVSGWFNASGGLATYAKIANKSYTSNAAPYTIYCLGFDGASHLRGEMDGGGTQYTVAGTTTLSTATYYYGTFTYDGTTLKLFLNGAQEGNTTSHTGTIATDNVAFSIGEADYSTPVNFFTGTIDEVEVSNIARPADWIKLCYATQNPNQTTVIVQENYTDWTYSQNLYLNTKATGANVSNNVIKFPMLIRLDTTNFDFTKAQGSGQDIRFAKQDGTHLYYQIEQWDNVNQAAAIWVRADTVYGNDSSHYLTMYWGNNKVNDMSNGKAVFDTGNGFVGVWHLNNSDFTDATCNHHNATNGGTTDTAAVIGSGRKFIGTDPDSIQVSGLLNSPTTVTMSCWAKVDSIDGANLRSDMISIGNNCDLRAARTTDGSRDSMRCNYYSGAWNYASQPGGAGLILHAGWKYLTWMANPTGSSEVIYVNGASVASAAISSAFSYTAGGTNTLFGKHGNGGNYDFGGVLNEVRIEKSVRDQYWVKLCYQNQQPNQSLVVFTNEDYSKWAYSRKVNLNTTPCGANVYTNQINFPTLIRLTSTNYSFAQAIDDGSDIRFASSLGKHLPYQIERWDRGNQLAELWVLADTIKGNNGTQYLTMYWGKAGAVNRSNGAAVFDTANGFAGVWHLGEGSGNAFDATANGINDTAKGTVKYHQTGGVAYSDSLTGTSSYFKAGDAYKTLLNMSARDKVTVSAWVNRAGNAAAGAIEGIVGKYQFAGSTNYREYMLGNNSGSGFAFYISTDGTSTNETTLSSGIVPVNGNWYFVTGVMDATNMTIFVNGLQKAQTAKTAISTTTTAPFKIGLMDDDGSTNKQYFNGEIDEVIVGDTNRSADWIKLCYQNQKANQTLVDLEDYGQWASSKKIYINTTVVSPVLTTKVAMFPLLVRLDTTMINFNTAQSSGQDIRFSRADGTHFYYEKEKWDQANKNAALWVLVDTILPSSSTQYITMYWGKSDAVDKSNSSAVFDTANSFVAAYHFSVSDTFGDATYNSNDGTNFSTTPNASSIIGYGRSFAKASTQKITAADANVLDLTGSFTLSAWINPTTLDTADIIGKDSTAYDLEMIPTKYLRLGSNKTYYLSSAASTITAGSWYHVAVTYNSTGNPIYFYVNGSQVGTSVTGAAPVATATTLYMGARASGKYFNGSIDEPRVEKACRSADWINLCYWTQKAGISTVITDTSSEAFLPLTVSTYPAASTSLDSCNISTHNWTIKFSAANKGGGIYWLSPDSMGTGTNQLDTNLFTIITGTTGTPDSTSKGAATLTLLDNSNVYVRLMQQRIIGTTPFQVYYTVQGNGKVFIRVYTYAAAAATMTNGLEFRIGTNGASGTTNYCPSATPSSCNYLLHCDPASNRLDPCLTLFENWAQATSITSGTRYVGIQASSWSLPAKRSQAWEFMLDFAHRNWNDSTGVGSYVSEYSHPDSLAFYSGTPYLEKTWEDHLTGHWKFEEGAGDTAFDNSGSNNPGIRTPSSTWTWTNGEWGGGLSLRSGDSVKVLDNTLFDGSNTGFAVMAWVNPIATMTGGSGIFKKSSGTAGYAFSGSGSGSVQLNLGGTAFPGRTNVGAGSWRHVGAVYQKAGGAPDTIKLYVDGKSDTIITGSVYSFNSSGTNALMATGFSGTLDDVRFYNEALSDEQFKTIYQLGYCSGQGMYWLRADNNNAVNFTIDGGTYHRNFPVFQITNWWNGAALGANNPYVYVNGIQLTWNKDYYVMTDLNRNKATVGFNRAINANGTQIYIGGNSTVASTTNAMPQMTWGSFAWPSSHFYVKNFSGNTFGSSTANQYYFDFKMDNTATAGNGGEIFRFKTSKISPNAAADTTSTGNLVSIPSSTDTTNFGCAKFKIGTSWLASMANVEAAPAYTVVESSAVRVVLQINDRTLKHSTDSCYIRTWFTFYPTGQIFRWDSVSFPAAETKTIDTVRYDVLQNYAASGAGTNVGTIKNNTTKVYGGIYGATALQDYAAAFLFLDTNGTGKLNGGTVAPSIYDTAKAYPTTTSPNKGTGTRFVHCGQLANNKKPYQFVLGIDIQQATFTSALVDSVRKGLQWDCAAATEGGSKMRLIAHGAGSTISSAGDYDTNGFNEREGAYVYQMDNTNTAHFYLTALHDANGDTCRLFPAFRLTHYYATTVPQYIFVNNQQLVQGFGYNAYVKQSTSELILQLNQKLCGSNADIYISSSATLAVTLDQFNANGADGLVRLVWQTESEENNLGFFLYRRVNPRFIDSLIMSPAPVQADTTGDGSDEKTTAQLLKSKAIGPVDTLWTQVNDHIIYGALAGVSYGKRSYSLIDRNVLNSVQYQYKLVAVDYNNGRDAYDKLAGAMPHQILPSVFELHGNYPNPFRGITYLKFDVPVKTRAMLNVYSMQGRLVRHIVKPDNVMKPGFYHVTWDGKDDAGRLMASGPYVYRLSAPGFAKAKVMIVMK
jgi:autotransporter-associated beta strand protein